jgi:hypothetical protein
MSGIITQYRTLPHPYQLLLDLGDSPGNYNREKDFDLTLNYGGPSLYQDVLLSDQTTTSFRSDVQSDQQDINAFGQVTYNPFLATNPDDRSDRGHEFYSIKREILVYPKKLTFTGTYSGFYYRLRGTCVPYVSGQSVGYESLSKMSDNDIKYYGTTAIAKCEPTNPAASLSTFLGEIFLADKELPQFSSEDWNRFFTGGGKVLPLVGDTFILGEFGFRPFLNDVTKLMKNVQKTYKLLQQYSKDSGKPIRRRFKFAPIIDITPSESTLGYGKFWTGLPVLDSGSNVATQTKYLRTEIWFSGEFMYYLPVGKDLLSRFARYNELANHLLGSDMTPSTIWELAPWSWLVDWKVDVGNAISISNSMTQHGLVLRYGYLMRRQTAVNELTVSGVSIPGQSGTRTIKATYSVVQKERHRATPYGFGVDPQGFNPEQIAILLGLGLSRGLIGV